MGVAEINQKRIIMEVIDTFTKTAPHRYMSTDPSTFRSIYPGLFQAKPTIYAKINRLSLLRVFYELNCIALTIVKEK